MGIFKRWAVGRRVFKLSLKLGVYARGYPGMNPLKEMLNMTPAEIEDARQDFFSIVLALDTPDWRIFRTHFALDEDLLSEVFDWIGSNGGAWSKWGYAPCSILCSSAALAYVLENKEEGEARNTVQTAWDYVDRKIDFLPLLYWQSLT